MFPLCFLAQLCTWTNMRVDEKLKAAENKPTTKKHTVHFDYYKGWLPLNVPELKIYFAIILLSRYSNLTWNQIWSKNANFRLP